CARYLGGTWNVDYW
nr:immunoglobulin heavy chain junction region [Macaca mulatta]